ncbi:hypothetical protein CC2G_004012 [Coprinopsis cinerea AmutBmut pab1-1]|nr:hypothetical protein CC2G_004012 [Coprinopsis cinerea AmutBmut pab1-1]
MAGPQRALAAVLKVVERVLTASVIIPVLIVASRTERSGKGSDKRNRGTMNRAWEERESNLVSSVVCSSSSSFLFLFRVTLIHQDTLI